jgi:hypothetical protein
MKTIFDVLSCMAEQEEIVSMHKSGKEIREVTANRSDKWREFKIIGDEEHVHLLREKIDVRFVQIMGLKHREMLLKLSEYKRINGHLNLDKK